MLVVHSYATGAPAPVDPFLAVRLFLANVRRRLRRTAALQAGLYAGALAVGLALVTPALALWLAPDHAASLGRATLVFAGLVGVVALVLGVILPRRRWRSDDAVSRFVGARAPAIASDLLSAVELERALSVPAGRGGEVSRGLVTALADSTARRASAVETVALVPPRSLRRPALCAGLAAAAALVALATHGDTLAAGWRRALSSARPVGPLPGARLSTTPVVGDITIRLDYPDYTRRPPATLPSSSGDFRAMPGTRVTIETTALSEAVAAEIAFDGSPDAPLPMHVNGANLSAELTVENAAAYRFALQPPRGTKIVEATPHQIEIEPDRPPVVDLYAPADELDVTAMKRIELAYNAEDDYGVAALALVWDPGPGSKAGRLDVPVTGRLAQGRFLWDLAGVPLPEGARVAYHLEARDNNAVGEPGVTSSRTYYLRVYSPRERHERLLERQQEMFEQMIAHLSGRLTVPADDVTAHRAVHRDGDALVVALGGLLVDLRDDPLATKELVAALADAHKRLTKLSRDEAELLGDEPSPQGVAVADRRPPAPSRGRLATSDRHLVAEVEADVLTLASWLDRQRLEDLLAIGDEIAAHRARLQELMAEYARTGSPDVRAEIDREMRALEQRIAELEARRRQLSAETLDRFVNSDALREEQAGDCFAEVRRLLDAGDVAAAQEKLARCTELLDGTTQALEQSLAELRADKFTSQEAAFGEMMNDLADLAQDQRDVADEADSLWERYAARADERMAEQGKQTRAAAHKLVDRLKKRLAKIPREGLTPFSTDEIAVVESRIADVDRMLGDGDLAEALAMARQAEASLEAVEADLGSDLDEGEPWNDHTPAAYNEVSRALPTARDLVELLERATPSPEEIMSPEDRKKMAQLLRRQQGLRERARRLGERARQQAGELPGESGRQVGEGLGKAEQSMGRAGDRMKEPDPAGSRQEARAAADELEQARQRGQGGARQQMVQGEGGNSPDEEPVRIPGAEDYKAPKRFREDIIEAMKKEKAPAGFAEQVRRYYEELIR